MKRHYKIILILIIFVISAAITIHKNTNIFIPLSRDIASAADVKKNDSNERKEGDYDLSSLQTLNGVLLNLSKCYVDPSRFNPKKMFKEALYGIQNQLPGFIARFNENNNSVEIQLGAKKETFDYSKIDSPWSMSSVLKVIFKFIKENLNNAENIKTQDIEYSAINGMLSTLDPHTRLLPPDLYKEMKMDTEGEFGGLGIVISSPEGKLTINEVLEGTPAEEKGLKCGDQIVQIGEESTVNMDLDEAVSKLRGKPGTSVTIWIIREGMKQPKKIEIERANIHIQSVKYQMLDGKVGYVKLSSFQENTYEDLKNALEKLRENGMKGLILDMRFNAGGLLDQAIAVADVFLYTGTITTTRVPCNATPLQPYPAKIGGSEPNYPIIVLMNRESASAAEIVAGALKNHNRALTMGERTFGKGSIQQLKEMRDGSALKYTIGEYLTPGDISIQSIGVVPDVQLVPLVIGKKDLNIVVSKEDAIRESSLDRHLVSDRTIGELESKETVEYVYYSKTEEKNVCPLPFDKIVKDDYEVKIAHDILLTSPNSNRIKMMDEIKTFLTKARASQDEELQNALKKFKIDWQNDCSNETPPPDAIKIEYYEDNKPVKFFSFDAGTKAKIKVEVKNEWDKPLCRLYAITQSDNKLLSKRDFVFGKILPGKKKSWESEIEIPQSSPSRIDPIKLDIYTYKEKKILTAPEIRAVINESPQPVFSVAYEIKDDIKGNFNDILEPGEEGKLYVKVKNTGKGKSKSLSVYVKNTSGEGVYIVKGRESLENLLPGKEFISTLKIKLLPSYEKKDFKLKISVQDSNLPVRYETEAKFPSSPEKTLEQLKSGSIYDHTPVITITSTNPEIGKDLQMSVRTPAITIRGTVEDDTHIEDMYIYADVDKIFYKSNAGSASPEKMDFEATVPLHGGVNVITIFARQDSNSISMKKLIIRRDDPQGLTMPTPKKTDIEEEEE